MPDIRAYLSDRISSVEQEQLCGLLKYNLKLNFYGFLLELKFAHLDDIGHYEYYFKYFVDRNFCINTKLTTSWIADSGCQPFTRALENPKYLKKIHIFLDEGIFLYDSFSYKSSQPSLIPPLHIYPFNSNHIGFHGAALTRDQKSILIFGKNNSGKSTCSISLIFNGYKLLSDDTVVYDSLSNQILAFPRPIGLRQGTLKAYPAIKNALHSKQLVKYKAIDYIHLMISPEELLPGCVIDSAKPSVAIFLRNVSGCRRIAIDKVDTNSLIKLLKIFSYYSELGSEEHSKKIKILSENLVKAYIVSFDIKLTKMSNIIELIDRFLVN